MLIKGLSVEQQILLLRHNGSTYREIGSIMNVSFTTIKQILSGHKKEVSKVGAPKKVTEEICSFIEAQSLLNSLYTNEEIRDQIREKFDVSLSVSSVSTARVKLGFRWRPPMRVQYLSDSQKFMRIQFATDMLTENIDSRKIIFTDESRFCVGPDNNWRHIKRGCWNETCCISE